MINILYEGDKNEYRYFPEPNLLPVHTDDLWIKEIGENEPELPQVKRLRYKKSYGISIEEGRILTGSLPLALFFEETVRKCNNPKQVSNWLTVEMQRLMKLQKIDIENVKITSKQLASLIRMTAEGIINSSTAKEVFEEMFINGIEPEKYVEKNNLKMISDKHKLEVVVEQVVRENAKSVEDYKKGKKRAFSFLVGQIMKQMQGTANPNIINQMLEIYLKEDKF